MGIIPTGDIYKGFVYGEKEGMPGRTYSKSFGVYITGEASYNAPERDAEMIAIPGRNGALYKDNGRFENIEVKYHCGSFAESQTDFADNISDFRNRLLAYNGYYYLYDDYNTDEFRMAVYKSGLEVTPAAYSQAGEFDIVFNCKPQRFLKSGDTEYSPSSGTLFTNPTGWDSQPMISFITSTGTGTITLTHTAGNQTITIGGAPTGERIYIDCEVGETYRKSGNTLISLNNCVSFGVNIPVFYPGSTTFTYSTSINTVKVTPRWWRI